MSRALPAKATSAEVTLTSTFTTALWVSCAAVGAIGVLVPYAQSRPHSTRETVIQAERIHVELGPSEQIPAAEPIAQIEHTAPPPTAVTLPIPSAPSLVAVAAPNSPVAFELPVAGPVTIVETRAAAYSAPVREGIAEPQAAATPLTFGIGEGKQPAPEYPARAMFERQEGVVLVAFTVGQDGRPISAEFASASPWPLLNESAIKTIRTKWRFAPGPIRRYEVPISFKLRK